MVKPDKGFYNNILDKLNLQNKDSAFVSDDECEELEGSKKIGVAPYQAFWFLNEYEQKFLVDKYKLFMRFYNPIEVLQFVH